MILGHPSEWSERIHTISQQRRLQLLCIRFKIDCPIYEKTSKQKLSTRWLSFIRLTKSTSQMFPFFLYAQLELSHPQVLQADNRGEGKHVHCNLSKSYFIAKISWCSQSRYLESEISSYLEYFTCRLETLVDNFFLWWLSWIYEIIMILKTLQHLYFPHRRLTSLLMA